LDRSDHTPPINWEDVLPFRKWLTAPALRRRSTLVFVVMVVAPAVIFWYVANLGTSSHSAAYDYKSLGWAFAGYIGVAWLIVLWILVRPKLVAWHAGLVIGLAVLTQVPLAIWLETRLHDNTTSLIPSILTVGVPEELAKLLPLVAALALTYILARHRLASWLELSPRSFLFLGAISGLAFGCAEQAHYLVDTYVPELLNSQNLLGGVYSYTEEITWRLISDPISHACWAGVTGYFIGVAVQRLRRIPLAERWYPRELGIGLIGLAIAAVLHGFNDDFATGGDLFAWVVVIAISTLLFVAYASAGEAVEKALVGTSRSLWTFHVGDLVQLPADPQPAFHTGPHQVPWKKRMNAQLGRTATIMRLDTDRTAQLDIDAGTEWWALDWLRPLLKVGDRVRIAEHPQPPFDAGGYMVSWQPEMDALCGAVATVTDVLRTATVHLDAGRPDQEWAIDWLDREVSGAPGSVAAPSKPTVAA
jgi:RsiW-degrading membrane proteinase PrsW (M82 family)